MRIFSWHHAGHPTRGQTVQLVRKNICMVLSVYFHAHLIKDEINSTNLPKKWPWPIIFSNAYKSYIFCLTRIILTDFKDKNMNRKLFSRRICCDWNQSENSNRVKPKFSQFELLNVFHPPSIRCKKYWLDGTIEHC